MSKGKKMIIKAGTVKAAAKCADAVLKADGSKFAVLWAYFAAQGTEPESVRALCDAFVARGMSESTVRQYKAWYIAKPDAVSFNDAKSAYDATRPNAGKRGAKGRKTKGGRKTLTTPKAGADAKSIVSALGRILDVVDAGDWSDSDAASIQTAARKIATALA